MNLVINQIVINNIMNIKNNKLLQKKQFLSYFKRYILLTLLIATFAIYASTRNQINFITQLYDSDAKSCGIQHQNHQFIFFTTPRLNQLWKIICVSQCPTNKNDKIQYAKNSIIKKQDQLETYPTIKIGKLCIPKLEVMFELVNQYLRIGSLEIMLDKINQIVVYFEIYMYVSLIITLILVSYCIQSLIVQFLIIVLTILIQLKKQKFEINQQNRIVIVVGICWIIFELLYKINMIKQFRLSKIYNFLKMIWLFVISLLIIILVLLLGIVLFWILYTLGNPLNDTILIFKKFDSFNQLSFIGLIVLLIIYILWTILIVIQSLICAWVINIIKIFKQNKEYQNQKSLVSLIKINISNLCKDAFLILIIFILIVLKMLNDQIQSKQELFPFISSSNIYWLFYKYFFISRIVILICDNLDNQKTQNSTFFITYKLYQANYKKFLMWQLFHYIFWYLMKPALIEIIFNISNQFCKQFINSTEQQFQIVGKFYLEYILVSFQISCETIIFVSNIICSKQLIKIKEQ